MLPSAGKETSTLVLLTALPAATFALRAFVWCQLSLDKSGRRRARTAVYVA